MGLNQGAELTGECRRAVGVLFHHAVGGAPERSKGCHWVAELIVVVIAVAELIPMAPIAAVIDMAADISYVIDMISRVAPLVDLFIATDASGVKSTLPGRRWLEWWLAADRRLQAVPKEGAPQISLT